MRVNKQNSKSDTIVEQFELELPEEFNIEPLWVVQISKSYECRIFRQSRRNKYRRDDSEPERIDGYYGVLRHKKSGLPPRNHRDFYGNTGEFFEVDPLDVRLRLESWATVLAPKKSTRTVVEEDYED